jgi:ribosomal protein L40E
MGNLLCVFGGLSDDPVGADYCVRAVDRATREEHLMSTTQQPPGLRGQRTARTVFRVVGVITLVVAVTFLVIGLKDFFGSADSFEGPHKFWMVFVGIFGLAIAGWCLQAGFMGAAARYAAGETVPTLKDSASYLTDGEGVLGIGRTVDDGPAATATAPDQALTGPFCSKCGTRNDAEASFCDRCGAALAH